MKLLIVLLLIIYINTYNVDKVLSKDIRYSYTLTPNTSHTYRIEEYNNLVSVYSIAKDGTSASCGILYAQAGTIPTPLNNYAKTFVGPKIGTTFFRGTVKCDWYMLLEWYPQSKQSSCTIEIWYSSTKGNCCSTQCMISSANSNKKWKNILVALLIIKIFFI